MMALLQSDKFDRAEKYRSTIHKQTTATYTSFEEGGNKYFQIDTYGSEDRVMTEKISQSIQFDKSMAKRIIDILIIEFNL
jgi:hypothetical protein